MYGCTLVFICVCLYVGLTMFNEKTNIHTYIQTNILSFSQLRFCDTSKLKSYVCLPMQAVEIYNQHGKSTVFSKTRNLHFHGQGYVFRRKPQKNVKSELWDVVYVCLDVNFADAGHGNGPSLHTYMDPCRFKDLRNFHVCLLFLALHRGNWLCTRCGFEKVTFFIPPQLVTYRDNYIVLVKEPPRDNFGDILGLVLKRLKMNLLGPILAAFWAWCQKGSKWVSIHPYIHTALGVISRCIFPGVYFYVCISRCVFPGVYFQVCNG